MHIREDVFSSLTAALGLSPQGGRAVRTGHAHHGHHHGEGTRSERAAQSTEGENPIMQALAQALESLGLSLSRSIPPTGTATSATTGATSSTASATATTASATTTQSASATQSTPAASSAPAAQSLPSGTASNSTPVAAPPATDGDDDGASGFVSVARDIRHLLHALFQDIRAENVLAPATTSAAPASTDPAASAATVPAGSTGTTTAAAPTSPFASGLAALISQVSSGSVPANLQNAFDKLVADLQQIGGVTPTSASSAGTASTSAPSTAASSTSTATSNSNPASTSGSSSTATSGTPANSPQALLLKFLTTLQQDLGYGTAASTGSTTNGLVVNTVA